MIEDNVRPLRTLNTEQLTQVVNLHNGSLESLSKSLSTQVKLNEILFSKVSELELQMKKVSEILADMAEIMAKQDAKINS